MQARSLSSECRLMSLAREGVLRWDAPAQYRAIMPVPDWSAGRDHAADDWNTAEIQPKEENRRDQPGDRGGRGLATEPRI
jgi:hypothetical protein